MSSGTSGTSGTGERVVPLVPVRGEWNGTGGLYRRPLYHRSTHYPELCLFRSGFPPPAVPLNRKSKRAATPRPLPSGGSRTMAASARHCPRAPAPPTSRTAATKPTSWGTGCGGWTDTRARARARDRRPSTCPRCRWASPMVERRVSPPASPWLRSCRSGRYAGPRQRAARTGPSTGLWRRREAGQAGWSAWAKPEPTNQLTS